MNGTNLIARKIYFTLAEVKSQQGGLKQKGTQRHFAREMPLKVEEGQRGG
jgi:hypothetical protein